MIKTYAKDYSQLFLRDPGTVWPVYTIDNYTPLNYVITMNDTVAYGAYGFNQSAVLAEIEANLPPTGINEGKVEKPLSAVSVAPNPATDRALISFSLAKAGNASVRIYSSNGELVRTVLNRTASAGNSSATWDLRNDAGQRVTTGMYFYEVKTGLNVAHGKVSVLN